MTLDGELLARIDERVKTLSGGRKLRVMYARSEMAWTSADGVWRDRGDR